MEALSAFKCLRAQSRLHAMIFANLLEVVDAGTQRSVLPLPDCTP